MFLDLSSMEIGERSCGAVGVVIRHQSASSITGIFNPWIYSFRSVNTRRTSRPRRSAQRTVRFELCTGAVSGDPRGGRGGAGGQTFAFVPFTWGALVPKKKLRKSNYVHVDFLDFEFGPL
ncbi:hypothetical protein EVAR_31011_1 [Eumeta japonica]|uniref:Uncharacterized protein n=1 Tax=Eumeta variegata TaxID=151549 RepID=A0A4C1VEH9_EUMVA|nr:hypothetical protein EVAR_31011_1 [Eumeta japonica]